MQGVAAIMGLRRVARHQHGPGVGPPAAVMASDSAHSLFSLLLRGPSEWRELWDMFGGGDAAIGKARVTGLGHNASSSSRAGGGSDRPASTTSAASKAGSRSVTPKPRNSSTSTSHAAREALDEESWKLLDAWKILPVLVETQEQQRGVEKLLDAALVRVRKLALNSQRSGDNSSKVRLCLLRARAIHLDAQYEAVVLCWGEGGSTVHGSCDWPCQSRHCDVTAAVGCGGDIEPATWYVLEGQHGVSFGKG